MKFRIRRAEKKDYDQLCMLYREFDRLHAKIVPDLYRLPEGPVRDRNYIISLFENDRGIFLVAEEDGKIVACVHGFEGKSSKAPMYIPLSILNIDHIIVAEDHRREGIAKLMMAKISEWAKERWIDLVQLHVYESNKEAISFYRSAGFGIESRKMTKRLQKALARNDN